MQRPALRPPPVHADSPEFLLEHGVVALVQGPVASPLGIACAEHPIAQHQVQEAMGSSKGEAANSYAKEKVQLDPS